MSLNDSERNPPGNPGISDARFSDILELTTDFIWECDLKGTLTYLSPKVTNVTNYTPEELLGRNIIEFVLPEYTQWVKTIYKQAIKNHIDIKNMVGKMITKDGRTIDIRLNAKSYLCPKEEHRFGLRGTINDITELKRVERRLLEGKEFLSSVDDVIWISSPDGQRIIFVNPAFERIYGLPVKDYLKNPNLWLESVHPEDRHIAEESNTELFALGHSEKEYRIVRPEGKVIWLHDKKNLLYDANGNIISIGGIARDITQRKNLEIELIETQKQLRVLTEKLSQAEEKERRRVAMELHDNVSQNLAYCKIKLKEIIRENTSMPQINPINNVCDLISDTILNLRSMTFELSPPVLYELGLEAAIEWLAEQILRSRGIKYKIGIDEPLKLLNQEMKILTFQIIREIFTNIFKHAHAKEVLLFIRSTPDKLIINVSDDGIGFDEADIKRQKSGGYGLFSIRERLNHVDGQVNIESSLGLGTKTEIIVPIA